MKNSTFDTEKSEKVLKLYFNRILCKKLRMNRKIIGSFLKGCENLWKQKMFRNSTLFAISEPQFLCEILSSSPHRPPQINKIF